MTRISITFDADLTDDRNTYVGGDIANIGEAIVRGLVPHGSDVYVELGTGDAVKGSLVSVSAEIG